MRHSMITTAAFLMMVFPYASCLKGGCPCSCEPYEGPGSYVLDASYDTESVEQVTGAGAYEASWADASGDCYAEVFAAVVAVDYNFGSDSANAICLARQAWRKVYVWTGTPEAAPGALYTGRLQGSGHVTANAQIVNSGWAGSASASGDSSASGAVDGAACEGSQSLSNVSGGVQGVGASVDQESSASVNVGIQTGESQGFQFGGSSSISGNHTATITRTWTVTSSAELCIGAGATEIQANTQSYVTGIASAFADASAPFGYCETQAYANSEANLVASLGNLRRCD